jgi:hypothetical protein
MTLKNLIIRFILCLLALILFVYCLPAHAERLTVDQIETIAFGDGYNYDGDVGRMMELGSDTPKCFRDGKYNCQDRAWKAYKLCKENGYESKIAYQYDRDHHATHMYLKIKEGKGWTDILTVIHPDQIEYIQESLNKMKRR